MDKIKIATFNTHHGKEKGVKYSTEQLANDIQSLGADIICLQEVDSFSFRTKFANQSRAVAKHLGFYYKSSFIRFFGAGFQHNSILSKFPISSHEQIILPSIKGEQKRIAQKVVIETENSQIIVANTHLHSGGNIKDDNSIAKNQLNYLTNILDDEKILLMGDFNMTPDDVLPIIKENNFEAQYEYLTSPASNPKNQIDWITSRGYELTNTHISQQLCSDHRALMSSVNVFNRK